MEQIPISGPYAGQSGCFKDITRDDYQLKMEQVSQSWLSYFHTTPTKGKTPLNFYHEYIKNQRVRTDAFRFGDAFHTKILEPEEYKRRAVSWTQTKTSNSVAFEKAEKDLQQGQMLVPEDWKEKLDGIFQSISNNDDIMDLLDMPGDNECTLLHTDKNTGVQCKSRLDRCVTKYGLIIDLKTTKDASESGFSKSLADYEYHMQAYAYMKAYEEVFGEPANDFVFILCEKEPPYLTALYYLHPEALEAGQYLFDTRIQRYAECVKNQNWPGYQEHPIRVDLPQWYHRKIENGEI